VPRLRAAYATVIAVGLAVALIAAATPESASAAEEMTRDEALVALRGTDVEARRLAVRSFVKHGTMADVPRLVEVLRDGDAEVRALAERVLWHVWSRSGDDAVDRRLLHGIEQMHAQDGAGAVDTFTDIIRDRPDFAEAWNKRATVYYLLGEYRKSLADCDEVVKRNPWHFGALSGYGMIYLQLDDPARALQYFERALAVNPNLDSVRDAAQRLRALLIQRGRNTL